MTTEELRALDREIAAKVMGWTIHHFHLAWVCDPGEARWQNGDQKWRTLPNYSTDLNACFEAQAQCIEKVGLNRFLGTLVIETAPMLHVTEAHSANDLMDQWALVIMATAEQRCRAMLAAVSPE